MLGGNFWVLEWGGGIDQAWSWVWCGVCVVPVFGRLLRRCGDWIGCRVGGGLSSLVVLGWFGWNEVIVWENGWINESCDEFIAFGKNKNDGGYSCLEEGQFETREQERTALCVVLGTACDRSRFNNTGTYILRSRLPFADWVTNNACLFYCYLRLCWCVVVQTGRGFLKIVFGYRQHYYRRFCCWRVPSELVSGWCCA